MNNALRVGEALQPDRSDWSAAWTSKLHWVRVLLITVLREIFEESSYARFLGKHGLSASRNSYAAFLKDQENVRARRPRCC